MTGAVMALASSGGVVTLPGATVSASSTSGTASVTVTVSTAGQISASASGQSTSNGLQATTPQVLAPGYVKVTGAFGTGTFGQWLDRSAERTWTISRSTPGTLAEDWVVQFASEPDRPTYQMTIHVSASLVQA